MERLGHANPARLSFRWEGQPVEAREGDSVAGALYANGIRTLARSRKFHRPRGLPGAYVDGVLARVDGIPNVRLDALPAREGLEVRARKVWPNHGLDLLRLARLIPRRLLRVGFEHPSWLPSGTPLVEPWERALCFMAGGAEPPDADDRGTPPCPARGCRSMPSSWEALYDRANVQAGEHVLIHAGAGGTSHVAVQLARPRGARGAATVRDAAKAAFVQNLGVELPIRYRDEDFVAATKAWTNGRGLDVALDNLGAKALRRTFGAMAPYGRVATLMGTPGDTDEATAYIRNLTIHNVMMLTPMWLGLRPRLAAQARIVASCLDLMARGKLELRVIAMPFA
ncbi:MAG: hypothetical protein EXQ94_11790 [Alphaproteobacteria bacterium]|nr:hypothetical protein [Alphaproteobacteria bacterium]